MGEESLILRLSGLALAYGIFTLTIETSKRPIRKIVECSTVAPIGELVQLVTAFWKDASASLCSKSSSRQQPRTHVASKSAPTLVANIQRGLAGRSRSADEIGEQLQSQPLAKVAVEDLCDRCHDGWVRAEELGALLSGVNCAEELFQPCRLCSERQQGLSKLEKTLFEHNSPPASPRNISLYATA